MLCGNHLKCLLHVQHYRFSIFNNCHWFVVLSLPFRRCFLNSSFQWRQMDDEIYYNKYEKLLRLKPHIFPKLPVNLKQITYHSAMIQNVTLWRVVFPSMFPDIALLVSLGSLGSSPDRTPSLPAKDPKLLLEADRRMLRCDVKYGALLLRLLLVLLLGLFPRWQPAKIQKE